MVQKVALKRVEVSSVAKEIQITQAEADSYYHATNELYDMYVEAAEHIIENDLFFDMGVPFNLVEAIKKSWENDVHWHICGNFIFQGGYDGKPLLLEGFEADTPSDLVTISQEQPDDDQFNELYENIATNFKRLITLDEDIELFEERYDGWKILFSAADDDEKGEESARFLQQLAEEAGFETGFCYLHEVNFSEDGISDHEGEEYEYWCKNYNWSDMASQEPELVTTLTSIMKNQKAIIINPAYTAIFESKGIIDLMRELFPDSPYLAKKGENTLQAKVVFAYEASALGFFQEDTFIAHRIV